MCQIGIDIGTTNWKIVVADTDGSVLATYACPAQASHWENDGPLVYDAEAIWLFVCTGMQHIVAELGTERTRQVTAVAAASVGESGFLLDSSGAVVFPAIAWHDNCTSEQASWWRDNYDTDQLYAITGFPLQPIASVCKIMWVRRHYPERYARAQRWLCVADYVAYRLCGVMATDYSLASRTMAFDLQRRVWSEDVLTAAGISRTLMAPTAASGTCLGKLTKEAAAACGLPSTVCVVAGGHDHLCGALAAGAIAPGDVLDSMGTAEALLLTVDTPAASADMARSGVAVGCHVAKDKYYYLGSMQSSGGTIEWLRTVFPDLAVQPAQFYQALMAEAVLAPLGAEGCLFHPALKGSVCPPRPDERGAWLGLSATHQRRHLLRAVLEGLSYAAWQMMDTMCLAAGQSTQRILVIGGGVRNSLWMEIKAAMAAQSLSTLQIDEAVALGAALLAGLGAGIYTDEKEALAAVNWQKTVEQPPLAANIQAYSQVIQAYAHMASSNRF